MRLLILILILTGCTTVPRQFNTEDTQDQSCYAKYGALRGYCDAVDEDTTVDVFDNNCLYDKEIE